VEISWSAKWKISGLPAGSFNTTTGSSVEWTAPSSTGDVNITATYDDSGDKYNDSSENDTITIGVVSINLDIWNGKTNGIGDPVADDDEENIGAYLLVN